MTLGWKLLAAGMGSIGCALAQTTVLYETNFERAEGFDPAKDLAGQRGWTVEGTGGNGLLEEEFTGFGQQAYIGFAGPADTNAVTTVWRPVDFDPATASYPLVKFSSKFEIVLSSSGSQDDFRWSIYNSSGDRLFTIDFETSSEEISYVLQDGEFRSTGSSFMANEVYDLEVWMDFQRNEWSAFLDGYLLVNSEMIAQDDSPLNFGDADAVWYVRGTPAGNNFMAFDNYRVTAETLPALPGYVEPQGVGTNGFFSLRAFGAAGAKYSVDVTTDFVQWFSLGEFENTDGIFDFEDTTSKGFERGFYRLRPVQ